MIQTVSTLFVLCACPLEQREQRLSVSYHAQRSSSTLTFTLCSSGQAQREQKLFVSRAALLIHVDVNIDAHDANSTTQQSTQR